MPTRRCNGKYCLGKFLPLNRFHANKSSNIGKKNECKMCTDAKYLENFEPGICIRCNKQHDCSFGSGIYCSRLCATGRNASLKTSANVEYDKTKYRKCSNQNCSKKDEYQPIENFYKRNSKSHIRRSVCKYCALEAVRKCQTSFDGFIKHSIASAKKRARISGIEFALDFEMMKQIYDQQNGKCAITGMTLTHNTNESHITARTHSNMSIDRIDSNKGYTEDNVQWVCVWVQISKSDWNQTDFEKWIIEAASYLTEKNK